MVSHSYLHLSEQKLMFYFIPASPTTTIQGSEEVYVVSGMSLELVCSGTGAPPPDLSWSVNGRSFSAADDRVTMSGGTLTISSINEADSGAYYCTAQSSAGTVASSVNVQVLSNESLLPSEVLGTRRQNMQLDCVPGLQQGAKVMWVFKMMSLVDSDKYSVTENGSLIVRSIDLADMGIYMCILGDIAINVTLTVQCTYMYPNSFKNMASLNILYPLPNYGNSF